MKDNKLPPTLEELKDSASKFWLDVYKYVDSRDEPFGIPDKSNHLRFKDADAVAVAMSVIVSVALELKPFAEYTVARDKKSGTAEYNFEIVCTADRPDHFPETAPDVKLG